MTIRGRTQEHSHEFLVIFLSDRKRRNVYLRVLSQCRTERWTEFGSQVGLGVIANLLMSVENVPARGCSLYPYVNIRDDRRRNHTVWSSLRRSLLVFYSMTLTGSNDFSLFLRQIRWLLYIYILYVSCDGLRYTRHTLTQQ
jgi:hypothetical protein